VTEGAPGHLPHCGGRAHGPADDLRHTPDEEACILGRQCPEARVEPEDVASLVLFLASDDARMCTAHECFGDAGGS
jgi:D-xylose 1-dehydrogenase